MATFIQRIQQIRPGRTKKEVQAVEQAGTPGVVSRPHKIEALPLDMAPNDPLVAYFLSAPGAVEIDKLNLDSPALKALKATGVQVVIPLVSQGEQVGLLNLGPR